MLQHWEAHGRSVCEPDGSEKQHEYEMQVCMEFILHLLMKVTVK